MKLPEVTKGYTIARHKIMTLNCYYNFVLYWQLLGLFVVNIFEASVVLNLRCKLRKKVIS